MQKSFSSKVKDELCELNIKNAAEAAAELDAILLFGESCERGTVTVRTDRAETANRIRVLIKKALGEDTAIDIGTGKRSYSVSISEKLTEKSGLYFSDEGDIELDEDVYSDGECARAFLRGAFISGGTIASPVKNYRCELFTANEMMALLAAELMEGFSVRANTVKRKNYFVTYIRDFESAVDFLNIIGAHKSMMELMMTQIEKNVRNNVNRQANCRAANIDKSIRTSVSQCEAIERLVTSPRWDALSEETRTMALLRAENPDKSLAQIGEMMQPPVSKSAVSRRMKKLIELAEEL